MLNLLIELLKSQCREIFKAVSRANINSFGFDSSVIPSANVFGIVESIRNEALHEKRVRSAKEQHSVCWKTTKTYNKPVFGNSKWALLNRAFVHEFVSLVDIVFSSLAVIATTPIFISSLVVYYVTKVARSILSMRT